MVERSQRIKSHSRGFRTLVVVALFASFFGLVTSGHALESTGLQTGGVDIAAPGPILGRLSFDADPLGLIKRYEVTSGYGLASDSFEVWVCETPHGDLELTPKALVGWFTAEVVPFLSWQSDGKYQVSFNVGGTVTADSHSECKQEVIGASQGGSRGALIVQNRYGAGAGLGSPGITCYGPKCEFPSNRRVVTILSIALPEDNRVGVVLDALENGFPSRNVLFAVGAVKSVVHEMGHSIAFPHSYTGTRTGFFGEYDNEMDYMSGGVWGQYTGRGESAGTHVLLGTIAVNRYAAGWISPDQVDVHTGGKSSYTLAAVGEAGTQMLAVPSGVDGVFTAMGTRVKKGYDSLVPKEGVEIYFIDQRTSCTWGCWGIGRRTQPFPIVEGDSTAHVLGVHESAEIKDGVVVTVQGRVGDSYIVEVDSPIEFEDVPDGHIAESAIDWAADSGITVGVGNNRFGLGQTLTRYEMVTLLCRGFNPGNCRSGARGSDRFEDVPEDHWANHAVGWAVSQGITSGVSLTEFGGSRTLPREQMMAFLHRARGRPGGGSLGSDVYEDVPDDRTEWANAPIGWAFDQGITGGIAEGVFGFGANLSREEMVLFLCRTLAPDTCPPSQEPVPSSVVNSTP